MKRYLKCWIGYVQADLNLRNRNACFLLPNSRFLGHIVSKDGIKVDPKKCSAIVHMPMPANKTEFLGTMNYIGKFIPKMSQVTQPMRILLEKDAEFLIDRPQVDVINESKAGYHHSCVPIFNPNNPIRLRTDASSIGLGALIEQKVHDEWNPIGYASRSPHSSEKHYAQIE